MVLDYSLYLVTDRTLSRGRSMVDIVRAAVSGGVTCVQLREKQLSTRSFLQEARLLLSVLRPLQIPLIINDRLDVAMAVGADGVHLGQQDMPIADARRITGNTMIIGISAETVEDAIAAEGEGADYVGISPVFATPTKHDHAPPLGLSGVSAIRAVTSIPLVGIGGITVATAASVIAAGADGVAVVSAIVSAELPERAASDLRQSCQFAPRRAP